jgi:glutathione S-transferase
LNPLLEVPAITYGSPSEKDGQPSPDAFKLYESSVIAEFIADLYPTSSILPKDPVAKAKVRFFVDLAAKKLIPSLGAIAFAGASYQSVLGHIEKTQSLLDPKLNFFAGDKITLADAVLAPFFCSLHLMAGPRFSLKEDGEMAKLLNALKEDKYSTFLKYLETLASHPTVKGTFDEVRHSSAILEALLTIFDRKVLWSNGRMLQSNSRSGWCIIPQESSMP